MVVMTTTSSQSGIPFAYCPNMPAAVGRLPYFIVVV
jgi:hypothetical protein